MQAWLLAVAVALVFPTLAASDGTLVETVGDRREADAISVGIPVGQPIQIVRPGNYMLVRNLTVEDGPAVSIESADVTLDLNGFTIQSGGSGIRAVGVAGISIEGGNLVEASISLVDVDRFSVRNVSFAGGSQLLVETGKNGVISGNRIVDPNDVAAAIYIENGRDISIVGNSITNPGFHTAIAFHGIGCVISDNVISAPIGDGITATDQCIVRSNIVRGYGGEGIRVGGASIVAENSVSQALDATLGTGISAGGGSLIYKNTIRGGADRGLVISGDNSQVESNLISGAGSFGLVLFGNGNVLRDNTARGNGGIPANCQGPATTDFCDQGNGNTLNGDNYLPTPM